MTDAHADDRFHATMAAAGVSALWEQDGIPDPAAEPPRIWAWATMEPLIEAAIEAVSMDDAERRVLTLDGPPRSVAGHGAGTGISLTAALQVLLPGERARPHRHTMNALRFVIDGAGAETIVDDKRCPMNRGDLVLTPGWTWHEHVHDGAGRVVWLDVLDVPLNLFLGNAVFEPGPAHDLPETLADQAFAAPGLVPSSPPGNRPYSPMFRYSWESAGASLAAVPAAADGTRTLLYTNPLTGGPALPTVECALIGLGEAGPTTPYRTNSSAGCVVLEGAGSTIVGETTLEWTRNDIFTLPAGHWISHRAASRGTILFVFSDRVILDRLGLLRDQAEA